MSEMSQQWVRRAIAGDRSAFRSLVVEHSNAMFRLACRVTGNESAAEDVVQEAWIKAHANLAKFDGRASFSTWIHRITVNAALDLLRKQRSRERFEAPELASPPEVASPAEPCPGEMEDWQRLTLAALSRLSDLERAAFTLRHFEGHSIREICELLELRNSACKQAIFRAVHKLREQLQPLVTT